jgi:hypothetical protein
MMSHAAARGEFDPLMNRYFWLAVPVLVGEICVVQVLVPAKRAAFPCVLVFLAGGTFWCVRQRRRWKDSKQVIIADHPHDDVYQEVDELIAFGNKFRAIKRYRELTGSTLNEAKAVIDNRVPSIRIGGAE